MADHRQDAGIKELSTYFTTVTDWIDSVFTASPDPIMRGIDWGRLYELFHTTAYKTGFVNTDLQQLLLDPAVKDRKGIYEYLLVARPTPGCSTCGFSTKPSRRRLTRVKRRRPKLAVRRTARCVPSGATRTRLASTLPGRWKPTTSPPGRRVACRRWPTARCCACHTTVARAIDRSEH